MNKNRERYLERRARMQANQPKKLKRKKSKKVDNMEKFNRYMVGAFFLCSFYILTVTYSLDLSKLQCLQLYFLFLGIGFLIPIKLYRKKLTMSMYEYIIYKFMAFAPLLMSLTLLINSSYHHDVYEESYRIKSFHHSSIEIVYELENNQYQDREYLRTISQKDQVEVRGRNRFNILFADGLLGIRIILEKSID